MDAAKMFAIPTQGVVKGTSKAGDKTYTIDKKYAATGSPVRDITFLSDKGSALLKSTVTVKKLPDGNLSYDEALICTSLGGQSLDPTGNSRAELKKLLPERFRTNSSAIDAATQAIAGPMLSFVFGPPYPHLFEMLGDQETSVLYLRTTLTPLLLASVAKALPDTTPAERTAILTGVMGDFKKVFDPTKQLDPTGGLATGGNLSELGGAQGSAFMSADSKGEDTANQLTPLLFVVAFKGAVVETDGLVDPATGNVFWSLYPMGASSVDKRPIHLHLIVKPTTPSH